MIFYPTAIKNKNLGANLHFFLQTAIIFPLLLAFFKTTRVAMLKDNMDCRRQPLQLNKENDLMKKYLHREFVKKTVSIFFYKLFSPIWNGFCPTLCRICLTNSVEKSEKCTFACLLCSFLLLPAPSWRQKTTLFR